MDEPTTTEGNDLVATIAYDRLERAIDERLGLIVDRIASEAIDAAMTEDLYGKLEETVRETLTTGAHIEQAETEGRAARDEAARERAERSMGGAG